MTTQPELSFAVSVTDPQYRPHFDGKTYEPEADHHRLTNQLARVRDLMLDGQPRTLRQLAEATGSPEASVSARIRDLRKPKFGGFRVDAHRIAGGLWTYAIAREP